MPTRRSFLTGSLTAAAASLPEVREAVRATIGARRRGLPTPADYRLGDGVHYLNHAAAGTVPGIVLDAHMAYMRACEANPAAYLFDGSTRAAIENVRAAMAAELHCAADELAFTHNTTEAFNVLAHGLPLGSGDEVLFGSLNHPGASLCWHRVAEVRGFKVRQFVLSDDRAAALRRDELVERHVDALSPATRVLVLPHVDNLIGLRFPIAEIAAAARDKGVRWIAVDGAQTAGMLPVDLASLGVDFFATSLHKWFQAPKESGLFYCRRDQLEHLSPMWTTWGQASWSGSARAFEDYGTRDLAKVLALGDALRFHQKTGWAEREAQSERLWRHARQRALTHPRTAWASPVSWQSASAICSVRVRGADRKELLDETLPELGLVFRSFHRPDSSIVRLSPNVAQDTSALDRFFDALPPE